jgi:DNA-binding response OmpR family regulator
MSSPLDPIVLRHILLVDDEPAVRLVLRRYLGRRGWTVAEAGNAEQAMCALEDAEHPVDAVIVDLNLPGISGSALCRRISTMRPALASRLIIASGDAREASAALARERLSCPVLAKPFELQELDRALTNVFRD